MGWLVSWSVGHVEKNPTSLHFPKFFDPLFFVLFLELVWANHQLMLTFCEMIHHHKLVSAQKKHLSLMLESHYLDPVDQHRDHQFISSCGGTNWCGPIGSSFVQPLSESSLS